MAKTYHCSVLSFLLIISPISWCLKPLSDSPIDKLTGNVEWFSISPRIPLQFNTNNQEFSSLYSLRTGSEARSKSEKSNVLNKQEDSNQKTFAASPSTIDSSGSILSDNSWIPKEFVPNPRANNDAPASSFWDNYQTQPVSRDGIVPGPPMGSYGGYPYHDGVFAGGIGETGGGGGPPEPPPPSIKGSIDYVLIPLILIGIAGPIFVVLYVVLGAFEAKLAPITARTMSWTSAIQDSIQTLKPATDLLFETMTNALDQHECLERALCHVGTYGRSLGLEKLTFLNKTLEVVAREPYKRSLQILLSSMTNKPERCSAFKCP